MAERIELTASCLLGFAQSTFRLYLKPYGKGYNNIHAEAKIRFYTTLPHIPTVHKANWLAGLRKLEQFEPHRDLDLHQWKHPHTQTTTPLVLPFQTDSIQFGLLIGTS